MGYVCGRKVNGDYFYIKKLTSSQNDLEFYTNQFNPDDYYIYKKTDKFKEVFLKEFFDFKYAGYIFFKKRKYDKKHIDIWIDWFYKNRFRILYLSVPPPPYLPEKIKIY